MFFHYQPFMLSMVHSSISNFHFCPISTQFLPESGKVNMLNKHSCTKTWKMSNYRFTIYKLYNLIKSGLMPEQERTQMPHIQMPCPLLDRNQLVTISKSLPNCTTFCSIFLVNPHKIRNTWHIWRPCQSHQR